jgi:Holliday junction resolvase
MMVNSIEKGKSGERELSHKLQEYGFQTRRGQQFCGSNGDADVVGLPGVHIECKRVEALNIDKALQQSIFDSRDNDEIPVVMHRKNRTPWKVTMLLDDFMKLYTGGGIQCQEDSESE